MGLAMRKKHYLNLKFPLLLWKQLLKESITIDDIQAIDLQTDLAFVLLELAFAFAFRADPAALLAEVAPSSR